MATIDTVIVEAPDPVAAREFATEVFGIGDGLDYRAGGEPSSGFRGFTLSAVVAQPATVDALVDAPQTSEAGPDCSGPASPLLSVSC